MKDKPLTSDKEITVDAYEKITVKVPVYGAGEITGTKKETYYQKKGTQTLKPTTETVCAQKPPAHNKFGGVVLTGYCL